jgi:hypothetical protein
MNGANRQKYIQTLEAFSRPPTGSGKQLTIAICLMKLDDYPAAQHFYGLSVQSAFRDRLVFLSGNINELVDAFILANQPSLSSRVVQEVQGYKLDPRSHSLLALYAYAVSCLITHTDEDARDYVRGLLNKPKIRWTFAMGMMLQAIINRDQLDLERALRTLLLAHERQVKFGGLREAPDGFACLSAMSLSQLALQRGLVASADSEFFVQGYLDYLQQQ